MDKNMKNYPLDVDMPQHCAYVVRDLPQATIEQRERALNATHWNEFAFPSGLLTVDMLSDSGTTAMTNQQWATCLLYTSGTRAGGGSRCQSEYDAARSGGSGARGADVYQPHQRKICNGG